MAFCDFPEEEEEDVLMAMKGLKGLQRTMREASRTIGDLDGNIANVSFDPHDPASIGAAIKQVEAEIDARTSGSNGGAIVRSVADSMKESYRNAILTKAAAARAKSGLTDDD